MTDTTSRRDFLKNLTMVTTAVTIPAIFTNCTTKRKSPNILFCISDDQSFYHMSAYGCKFINTPSFDRTAREGILFNNAFVSAPSCNPSRASILTGMPFYRLHEASMNHTPWPGNLQVYTDMLANAGYYVGYTGKGCGPTNWRAGGRRHNPAGPAFNQYQDENNSKGIATDDYAHNFKDFLDKRPNGAPFCFWYGGRDPHRVFKTGIGLREGKKPEQVQVPPIFPDVPDIRSDLLDYAVHIEWFDTHLGRMIKHLEALNELDQTIIVVTSDNGMAFPRAKATVYDTGTHMPLAIRRGEKVKAGCVVDDFVSFVDFAPTFLEAAGISVPQNMTGMSLMPILLSEKSGQVDAKRDHVIMGIERHFPGGCQGGDGYPIRAIRTGKYLYIKNYAPARWPVGDPTGPVWPADDPTGSYGDIDGSPTKTYMWKNRDQYPHLFELAFGKRPAEELYDVQKDPYRMLNLATETDFAGIKKAPAEKLEQELIQTGDPRAIGDGAILDQYARRYIRSLG